MTLEVLLGWQMHYLPGSNDPVKRGTIQGLMSIINQLLGSWKGTCQTWFEPGVLADESEIQGTFTSQFGDEIVRHSYDSSMQGKPRQGEELIAFNTVSEQYEVSWVDDFHMNYGILFSVGSATGNGFSVTGSYAVGENHPNWGWRTDYSVISSHKLCITMYNIMPGGEAEKAVEINYRKL